MIEINACTFFQENQLIRLHRTALVVLLVSDLSFMIVLKLLSICFKNHHKQRVDDMVKNKVLGKDVIKVEHVVGVEGEEQTGINLHQEKEGADKGGRKIAKSKKKEDESSESSSNEDEDEIVDDSEEKTKEKYYIELRKLKIDQNEMINIYNILLGHKFVCVAFGMLYHPFAEVSLLTFTQTISIVAYFILRVCGCRYNWIECLKGLVYLFNIVILSLAIYGMTTRVPKVDETSCFSV